MLVSFVSCKLRNLSKLLAVCCLLLGTTVIAQTGTWTPLTNLAPDFNSGVMLLLTDGTVLAKTSTGGTYGNTWNKLTPVNGSYINGTWSTIATMARDRLYFSTQVMPDGRLYVCGGEYGAGGSYGEIYNPATNTWIGAGGGAAFAYSVSDANSELLPDGTVLQACVDAPGTNVNFIWNPTTNTYSPGPTNIRPNNEAVWVKLPDSSILFMDNYSTTSERYIPQTNTWINDAVAPVNLFDPYGDEAGAGFVLPDGRVFFIGSTPNTLYYMPSGNTTPGTWALGPTIPNAYGAADAAAAMMPNGHILMALSNTPTSGTHFPSPTYYYEFDYTTNTFTQIAAPGGGLSTANSCFISNMLDLPDGSVLFANQDDNQYYEYIPGTAPLVAGQPAISYISRVNCDTFQVAGTLFNGICEGAAYGDDWQMSTNYPIVRMTNGVNTYYATTYNWNRLGAVMTGALPDTAIFKLPAGLPVGTYSVTVIANGNPSAPYIINTDLTITPSPITVCQGSTTTLSDVLSIGTWSSANTSIAAVDPVTGIVTGVTVGTTNISYTEGTCTSTAIVSVNSATPITGLFSVCIGTTVLLSDTASGGTWSSSTGNATIDALGNVTGVSVGTTTISYVLPEGCTSTAIVTVSAAVALSTSPVFTSPVSACAYTTATFYATCAGASSFIWTVLGTGWGGASTVDSDVVSTGSGTGTIICSGVNTCGAGPADTTYLTTSTGVGAASPIFATTSICSGSSATFITSGISGALSFVWLVSGAGWVGSSTTSIITVTVGSTPAVISVYGINVCGGGASYTLDSVYPVIPPTATFAIANHIIATGTTDVVTYTGTASATGVYTWNFGGGAAIPGFGPGPQTVSWGSTGLKTITLSVTDSGCSSTIYTDTVLVVATTEEAKIATDNNVIIYPNPNEGMFSIALNENGNYIIAVKITDIKGSIVYTKENHDVGSKIFEVDATKLPNAVYTATIITNNGVINEKVLVNRKL